MYTRTDWNDESGGAQSFRRGSHSIPASYSGNAFFADFEPEEEECAVPPMPEVTETPPKPDAPSKSARTFEMDDLLLIGLILLLSLDRERTDSEMLILLGLLFLTGFNR